MKRIGLSVLPALLLAGCGTKQDGPQPGGHHTPTVTKGVQPPAHTHDAHQPAGDGGKHGAATLVVQTDPDRVTAGRPATLKLMVHDAGGRMLKNFDVVHEQKLHLIIVRDGLDTFAHLHPAVDPAGNATVAYTFPAGGTYRLYADHQATGGKQATAVAEVAVAGELPHAQPLTPNVPGTVSGDGLTAKVAVEGAKSGQEATVRFDLTDQAGQPVADLQPYMGAMGHLVVLSADGKEYVHAHPADGKTAPGVVAFQAHFPKAGLYKGWGQFKRGGQVRVVPFVVNVP